MLFNVKNIDIEVSFYFLFVLSLILITNKSNLALYFLLSIIIHEFGHCIIILFYKLKVKKILFMIYGINIKIDNTLQANYKDILLLISGSLANFFIATTTYLIFPNQYIFSITNIFIGIFNLLPLDSLDGGKILNILLFSMLPMNTAYNILFILNIIFTIIFSTLNFLFIIHGKFNITLTILCIMLISKIIKPLN